MDDETLDFFSVLVLSERN